jgi:high-affinity iron transporter
MAATSSRTSSRRIGRLAVWLAGVAALAVVAIIAAALIPGGRPAPRFSVARVAHQTAAATQGPARVTKVFGSNIPAKQYGTIIAAQEGQGVDTHGRLTSDLSPLSPGQFRRPVAAYLRYAAAWGSRLAAAVDALTIQLRRDDRRAAEAAWGDAFSDYLRLGGTYGLLPAEIDSAVAGLPGNLGSARFAGLHQIERGLWTGAPPRRLVPTALALRRAVAALRRVLPHLSITPLDYATRAHEILEDAQRDFLSGAQVPWSGAGVLATEAGVQATREVIGTLIPLLQGRDNTLVEVQSWLGRLQTVITDARRPDGSWPSLAQLTPTQRERIDATLAGTLGVLSDVPPTLETQAQPEIPTIKSQEHP